MAAAEKARVSINEKEYEVELSEKEGKVYAKSHIDNFGEVTVSDFGGGKEKALQNIRARISNVVLTLQGDEAREQRRRDAAQAVQAEQNQN